MQVIFIHHMEPNILSIVLQCMEKVFKPTRCTKSTERKGPEGELDVEEESKRRENNEREGRHLNFGLSAVLGRSRKKKRRCLEWEQEQRWQIVETKQRF